MTLYDNNSPTSEIMLQAFYWDTKLDDPGKWYSILESQLNKISEAQINLVWLPPPSKSRVWTYVGYTPMDYYDLGEFKQWVQFEDGDGGHFWSQHDTEATLYGKKADLLSLLRAMKDLSIKSIADIVINHRAGQQHNSQGEGVWTGDVREIASGEMAWGGDDPPEITKFSGGSHFEDDGEREFGTNIAHANPDARNQIKEWLLWLKDVIGFDGWRYDYVKGYASKHIGEYNFHTKPYISIGEYWDGNAQLIYNWIDGSDGFDIDQKSMAFDFPLQSHLRNIFWGDKPFQELAAWKNSQVSITGGWSGKSVTFLDNHDTIRKAYGDFPADDKRLVQGYVFLLTHPGIPCIFWQHMFGRGSNYAYDSIKDLGNFRVNANITNVSGVDILASDSNKYVAMIDNHVIIKIGDDSWSPFGIPGFWNLKLSGDGWAIWQK
ncbi:MAG: alpha-amylase family glycosyl hydrolase [Cyanobacteria bacterium P01_A01_bin.40]